MALKEYQLLYLDNDIPINRSFYCNNGDIKSRGLEVHVLDNSQAKDCTGLSLRMIIKVPSGDLFEATVANGLVTVLNAATGIYQVLFPDNMGKGRLIAEIQLSNAVPEVIVSRKFSIIGDGSLTSDGVISELPKAGILWDVIKNEAKRQADFEEVLNNTDVAVAEKFANLETQYATDLTGVKSQLAETMNKTAITLNHIFADNTARDTYFTANPLEKINLTFVKVGTAYQQLINNVWTSASPVLAEVVKAINQPFTPTGGISAINTQAAIAELDTEKANKAQEAWVTPTLLNGWVTTIPVQYMKDSLGFVHFRGRASGGTTGTNIFTLPIGYRPNAYMDFSALDDARTVKIIGVSVGGVVSELGAYTNFISLAQISFKAEV